MNELSFVQRKGNGFRRSQSTEEAREETRRVRKREKKRYKKIK